MLVLKATCLLAFTTMFPILTAACKCIRNGDKDDHNYFSTEKCCTKFGVKPDHYGREIDCAARKIPKGQAIVFSTCCRNIGREGYMTSGYGTFAGDCG
jgi:YHS domain-containing protein